MVITSPSKTHRDGLYVMGRTFVIQWQLVYPYCKKKELNTVLTSNSGSSFCEGFPVGIRCYDALRGYTSVWLKCCTRRLYLSENSNRFFGVRRCTVPEVVTSRRAQKEFGPRLKRKGTISYRQFRRVLHKRLNFYCRTGALTIIGITNRSTSTSLLCLLLQWNIHGRY